MRGPEADAAFLWHMLGAARHIQDALAGLNREVYETDPRLQAMAERWLEVIGEAAGRVSAEFRQAHPEVPWRQIIAQRNIVAHMYYDLNQELVWKSATQGVEELIRALEPLVPPLPPEVD